MGPGWRRPLLSDSVLHHVDHARCHPEPQRRISPSPREMLRYPLSMTGPATFSVVKD